MWELKLPSCATTWPDVMRQEAASDGRREISERSSGAEKVVDSKEMMIGEKSEKN